MLVCLTCRGAIILEKNLNSKNTLIIDGGSTFEKLARTEVLYHDAPLQLSSSRRQAGTRQWRSRALLHCREPLSLRLQSLNHAQVAATCRCRNQSSGRHACHGIFSDRHGVMDSAWQGDAGSGSAAALLLRAGASPTGQLQLVKTAEKSLAKKDGRARDGLDSEEADSQSHRGAQWPLASKFILIKSCYAGKCCIFTQ